MEDGYKVNKQCEKYKPKKLTNMAAIFPLEFMEPVASPLRPSGPRAILMLPPNVNDPADMNDLYNISLGQHGLGVRIYTHYGLGQKSRNCSDPIALQTYS
jgi:hypothetical protein